MYEYIKGYKLDPLYAAENQRQRTKIDLCTKLYIFV